MGELEQILIRPFALSKTKPQELKEVCQSLAEIITPKIDLSQEEEIKIAFDLLREKNDEEHGKLEELKPVIEQEADPASYERQEYTLSIEYGGKTVKGYYSLPDNDSPSKLAAYTPSNSDHEK